MISVLKKEGEGREIIDHLRRASGRRHVLMFGKIRELHLYDAVPHRNKLEFYE